MSARRIEGAGLVDRAVELRFTFDGKPYKGYEGDTVASALLAAGVRILGRSFKYHRPRSVWGAWSDDPNAIVDIALNGTRFPNCQATTTYLSDGMEVRSVNAWPNANRDVKSVLNLASRFLPAGFYYKMFMWPDWHLFEPTIRKMAGIGTLGADVIEGYDATILHETCDLLVVGAGATGLAAARAAAEAGQAVLLVDDHSSVGGRLLSSLDPIDGQSPADWIDEHLRAIQSAGGRVLTRTTAIGVYDHHAVSLVEDRGLGTAPIVRRLRPSRMILATGAIDRPVTFVNNDRPGIMSLDGAAELLGRYRVLVGQEIAVLSNRPDCQQVVADLQAAGAKVQVLDPNQATAKAIGTRHVKALKSGGRVVPCDTVLASAGLTPAIHLWRHAGGKLDWDEARQAFLPGWGPDWVSVVGAANGVYDLELSLMTARAAGLGECIADRGTYTLPPLWPSVSAKGRQWLDFQHDVTVKDIVLAKQENMVSVEHLKRYTTLGMAGDQGKTSNMPALATMAELQGKPIPEVGTTTFRPPYTPIPLESYTSAHKGRAVAPLKRLALEGEHRKLNAAMGEYGGWLRPAWYGASNEEEEAVARECNTARNAAAIMDGSALGAIEVIGPDARAFVNFVYYNTMSTLKPGKIRYGFMLTEAGRVFDDGVMACIDDTRFVISCSSAHADAVMAHLENWRQDSFDPSRVHIHDATQNWSTVTIAGPKALEIVKDLGVLAEADFDDFPHMSLKHGSFNGVLARIARVSFTGDTSYEISVRNDHVEALWQAALEIGHPLGAGPVGTEALVVLRAEKGYILIGKDTDGETMPHDLGFTVPRIKKKAAFVGDRSLHTETANRVDRKNFVGLEVEDGGGLLPIGAHIVGSENGEPLSLGYVTSSHMSPTLGRPIALALLSNGANELGQIVTTWHMGEERKARVASPCALDLDGERIHA